MDNFNLDFSKLTTENWIMIAVGTTLLLMFICPLIKRIFGKKRSSCSSYEFFDQKETITLYHAKWCGHCQTLKPKWDMFVNTVNKLKLPVTLRTIEESTLHLEPEDIQKRITGFPAVLRSSNNKLYVGAQDIEGLMKEIQNTVTNKLGTVKDNLAFINTTITDKLKDIQKMSPKYTPKSTPKRTPKSKGSPSSGPKRVQRGQRGQRSRKPITMIFCYANTCGYCHQIMPKWLDLKQTIVDKKLPIVTKEFEASNLPQQLINKVQGFPTVFKNKIPVVGADNISKMIDKIKNTSKTFTLYYSKNCGYSVNLLPTWYKFVNKNNNKLNIKTLELDQFKNNQQLAKKITGFPTLIVTENGKERLYVGQNEIEKIIKPMI